LKDDNSEAKMLLHMSMGMGLSGMDNEEGMINKIANLKNKDKENAQQGRGSEKCIL